MNRGTSARSVSLVIVFLSHLSTGAMIPGVVNRRYVPVRVRVIQLTEFRLKGWNRHVLQLCRENHPWVGVEVRERRKGTSERSDVE